MKSFKSLRRPDPETAGLIYGFVGVCCFSLTLPATRTAVAYLHPTIVGLGRGVVAAILASIYLLAVRQSVPSRLQMARLLFVAAGIVAGFPLLSAWAMHRVPASHGAIVLGILPLATAAAGAALAGERPSGGFWIAGCAGSMLVVLFALITGGGRAYGADLALLGAIVAAAIGYAEGGRLARELGGAQVICWALLLSTPFILVPVALAIRQHGLNASPAGWLSFGYVSVVSMFLGFFAWYRGLALGGIARVGQLQLLQPFLTIFASAILLGEKVTPLSVGFALAVVVCVAFGRKAAVAQTQVIVREAA